MGIFSVKTDPKEIICRRAYKEFPNCKLDDSTYRKLQSSLIRFLREGKFDLVEKRLEAQQELLFLELHDFSNFMGVRLGLYAYALAILAIVVSNEYLMQSFKIPKLEYWIQASILFGIFIITSLRSIEEKQKERTIFLKFLLVCIEEADFKSKKAIKD